MSSLARAGVFECTTRLRAGVHAGCARAAWRAWTCNAFSRYCAPECECRNILTRPPTGSLPRQGIVCSFLAVQRREGGAGWEAREGASPPRVVKGQQTAATVQNKLPGSRVQCLKGGGGVAKGAQVCAGPPRRGQGAAKHTAASFRLRRCRAAAGLLEISGCRPDSRLGGGAAARARTAHTGYACATLISLIKHHTAAAATTTAATAYAR